MSVRPQVSISYNVIISPHICRLKTAFEHEATRLADVNAWPLLPNPITIIIFDMTKDGADWNHLSMAAILNKVKDSTTALTTCNSTKPLKIGVSSTFFVSGLGARLVALGASEEDAIFYSLAHEIHHLDECDRQNKCDIKYDNSESSLAGAVQPHLSAHWQAVFQTLTEKFTDDEKICNDALDAGHIANEAAADLSAIFWMRKAGLDWKEFSRRLVALRRKDIGTLWHRLRNKLKRDKVRKRPYMIARTLEAERGKEFSDIREIHARCWKIAVAKLSRSRHVSGDLRRTLKDLP